MAIAPNTKTLNSPPAVDAGVGSESANQLLAEIKAKVKAQKAQLLGFETTDSDADGFETNGSDADGFETAGSESGRAILSSPADTPKAAESGTSTPILSSTFHLAETASSPEQSAEQLAEQSVEQLDPDAQLSIQHDPPTFERLDVKQMAAEGYFQAIAYWLNDVLIPQSVYAQVLADEIVGRIKVLIEFEREPKPKRLVRLVCDRLYRLESDVIEGVHILARPIGTAHISWEKAVRLPTATERSQRLARQSPAEMPTSAAQKAIAPSLPHSVRASSTKAVFRRRFQFFRAAFLCGSAFAAFVFGSFFDLFLSDRLLSPAARQPSESVAPVALTSPLTPWYGETNEPDIFQPAADSALGAEATTISFRPASRFPGRTVEAALETVAVIPHREVANPSDPTITLLFGGALALNDFTFKDTRDLDTLFSEIDIYRQADVSMMSLAEPLAHASTSLQENFYQRTRPQAVKTLKAGGIDIVGLASDGSMTHGSHGLSETLNNLDREGIYRVGAGRNQQEAHRPEILEVKGQRIAYLGYSSDALKGARAEQAGVALTRTEERSHIREDIQAIRHQVDWVVVNYRWGEDLLAEASDEPFIETQIEGAEPVQPPTVAKAPEDWQKALAREAVDAGADLVVGSHPSQLQGVEIYRDRPIAYSIGDFNFSRDPQTDSLSARDTAALKVSLRNQRMKVEFLPVTLSESKLQPAGGEQGTGLLQSIRNASKALDNPLQFPAVLEPEKPKLPSEPVSRPFDQTPPEGTAVPESPEAMHGVIEVIQVEPVQPEPSEIGVSEPEPSEPKPSDPKPSEPDVNAPSAPDPMMQEPEALFMSPEASDRDAPEEILEETSEIVPGDPLGVALRDAHDTDVVLETPPLERELYPWQDPFESDDLRTDDLSTDDLRTDDLSSEDLSSEDLSADDESIRPYGEPIIGPLSSAAP